MEIKIGDKVRSFDFSKGLDLTGDEACYTEGKVVDFVENEDFQNYKIKVSKVIFLGKLDKNAPKFKLAPINGTEYSKGIKSDGVHLI